MRFNIDTYLWSIALVVLVMITLFCGGLVWAFCSDPERPRGWAWVSLGEFTILTILGAAGVIDMLILGPPR